MRFLKKKTKAKISKCCNGVISILLCIVVTPVLGIAGMLVEYSRYQSAAATLCEIMDCSSLSALADYDEYIQDRFGLFAVSQEEDIKDTYETYFEENVNLLGNAVTPGTGLTANGKFPLSDNAALKTQVIDFAESTDLTEFILKNLKLEELIQKLNELKGLSSFANTATKIADAAEKIDALIEAAENLKKSVESVTSNLTDLKTKGETLATSVADFCKKIAEEGFVFDETNPDSSYQYLVDTYLEDIKTIYSNYEAFMGAIDTFSGSIDDVATKFNDFTEAFDAAKTALGGEEESTAETEAEKAVEESTKKTTSALDAILKEFEDAIDDAAESLKEETIQNVKDVLSDLKDELINEFNLERLINVSDYFEVPLSDRAKEDLDVIIELLPEAWETNSYDTILSTLKDMFVPNIDLTDLSSVTGVLERAISNAESSLKSKVGDSLSKILTTLVNALRNIFKLDIFYNPDMNAMLSDACTEGLIQDANNPYADLLDAITGLFSAADEFIEGIKSLSLRKILKSIKTLFESVTSAVNALINWVDTMLEKMQNVVGWFTGGSQATFYEFLLLSAYMIHNLPNRTCGGDSEITINLDSGVSYKTLLTGESLTGYAYEDIPVSQGGFNVEKGEGETALDILDKLKGNGSDTMFKGAELEYIVGGTKSEVMNQVVTFFDIYMIRLLLDLPKVLTDPQVSSMAAAATIASWVVYILVIIGEPLLDTVLLVNGGNAPLIKGNIYLTPTGIPAFLTALAEVCVNNDSVKDALGSEIQNIELEGSDKFSFDSPGTYELSYETHVWLALLFTTSDGDMLDRLANLIQLESAEYYKQNGGPADFKVSEAYTAIETTNTITFESFLGVFEFADDSFLTKEFKRTRSY